MTNFPKGTLCLCFSVAQMRLVRQRNKNWSSGLRMVAKNLVDRRQQLAAASGSDGQSTVSVL